METHSPMRQGRRGALPRLVLCAALLIITQVPVARAQPAVNPIVELTHGIFAFAETAGRAGSSAQLLGSVELDRMVQVSAAVDDLTYRALQQVVLRIRANAPPDVVAQSAFLVATDLASRGLPGGQMRIEMATIQASWNLSRMMESIATRLRGENTGAAIQELDQLIQSSWRHDSRLKMTQELIRIRETHAQNPRLMGAVLEETSRTYRSILIDHARKATVAQSSGTSARPTPKALASDLDQIRRTLQRPVTDGRLYISQLAAERLERLAEKADLTRYPTNLARPLEDVADQLRADRITASQANQLVNTIQARWLDPMGSAQVVPRASQFGSLITEFGRDLEHGIPSPQRAGILARLARADPELASLAPKLEAIQQRLAAGDDIASIRQQVQSVRNQILAPASAVIASSPPPESAPPKLARPPGSQVEPAPGTPGKGTAAGTLLGVRAAEVGGQLGRGLVTGAVVGVGIEAGRQLAQDGRVDAGTLAKNTLGNGSWYGSLFGGTAGAMAAGHVVSALVPGGALIGAGIRAGAAFAGGSVGASLAGGQGHRNPGRIAAGAIGAGVGAFAGTALVGAIFPPAAFFGGVAGGLLGQVGGELIYDHFRGRSKAGEAPSWEQKRLALSRVP